MLDRACDGRALHVYVEDAEKDRDPSARATHEGGFVDFPDIDDPSLTWSNDEARLSRSRLIGIPEEPHGEEREDGDQPCRRQAEGSSVTEADRGPADGSQKRADTDERVAFPG